ncbi:MULTISPECIES: cell division protein SepF [Sinobaca]|uniref:Cell division protein SepF n=1 Tax=Sinobaca qinghaiensis TaxID=342944 RepID=A0A419V629_9BACL|nr:MULTISPECIES: cell division protein SepF [Sinobaca]RKD75442.1 cell division inhibitor SepF [Sinobaca qinghaiensis]
MGFKKNFKRFFELEDGTVEDRDPLIKYEEDPVPDPAPPAKEKSNVVSLQSLQQSAKMILVEPRTYEEAQDIADHLKNRKSVIINLQRLQHDQAKRIVDFLSGTVYAIGGDIQKVGENIFLCTPDNIDVSGAISEALYEHNQEQP